MSDLFKTKVGSNPRHILTFFTSFNFFVHTILKYDSNKIVAKFMNNWYIRHEIFIHF
jgi:hypothetical protein